MEEMLFKEIPKNRLNAFGCKIVTHTIFEIFDKYNNYPIINYCLSKDYNIIRARTYEFFKFHVQYVSSDYEDIRQFINTCYDVRSFHEPYSIVEKYKDDPKTRKNIIQRFIHLNSYLFPDSDKRKYDKSGKKSASDKK